MEVSEEMLAQDYLDLLQEVPALEEALKKLEAHQTAGLKACAIEFILEGLHLNNKLNKQNLGDKTQYRS
jgi:magnesium chelatase subunit I